MFACFPHPEPAEDAVAWVSRASAENSIANVVIDIERHQAIPINDVMVQIHASGFVPTELTRPSTWTDRALSREDSRIFAIVSAQRWFYPQSESSGRMTPARSCGRVTSVK